MLACGPVEHQVHSVENRPMIRVLIADDSAVIRDCLSDLLGTQPDLQVVGTASDGLEAVEKSAQLLPDVVIMDAQMPNMDGVKATGRIKQATSNVGILFFSVFTDYLEASIAAGADGYLAKDCDSEELLSKVRDIAASTRAGDLDGMEE